MDVGDSSKSKTLCSHRCILDDSCEGFYVEGDDEVSVEILLLDITLKGLLVL